MNEFRNLYTNETQFLLNSHQNNPGHKIIKGFFTIWKCLFLLVIYGIVMSIIDFFVTHEFMSLVSILALPLGYLWFWKLPTILTKKVLAKTEAVKTGRVLIRETTLVATRLNRERTSSSSNTYRDVYYASVWNENKAHTYDILTDKYVYSLPPESPIYIIRYLTNPNNPNTMEELVVSADFTTNPAYSTIYFD